MEPLDVLVVGGGQSGLAVGALLAPTGLRFAIAEAGPELGHVWRSRWDSLRLFTPVEHDALPGVPFPGRRGTHPGKDDVADYLRSYAERLALPVLLDTPVTRLTRTGELFVARTPRGELVARQVVLAPGPFASPHVPSLAAGLAADVVQLHSAQYRRPGDLPPGRVLVVGGGNSGRQVALELAASHSVALALGDRPRVLPQRLLGRDVFWWLTRAGLVSAPAGSWVGRRARARELVIGTPDRALRRAGVRLRSRLVGVAGRSATFADGAAEDVDAVLWATGFRSELGWLQVPGAVADGELVHEQGVTPVPGLLAVGLAWQRSRGSALLGFVGRDAAVVVEQVLAGHGRQTAVAAG